ncbi:hypothetical protein AVEN_228550-1 [Araneus ventricosus]|uniref:Uncharacterized protein n=1 Tax=Araneus ventricosus TaxID=182803 RepID=A0A4Y2MZS1_ARAVE|nr:hypothetical protein AVEN_228550-1 [Araneus ventricosus]
MYDLSDGSPCTANTWGYFSVHEKQEASRAATDSHCLPSREGRKSQKLKREDNLERRQGTRVPRGQPGEDVPLRESMFRKSPLSKLLRPCWLLNFSENIF